MAAVAEVLMLPFFAVLDFVLAEPRSAIVTAACLAIGVAMLLVLAP
jgi:hypothetical protein